MTHSCKNALRNGILLVLLGTMVPLVTAQEAPPADPSQAEPAPAVDPNNPSSATTITNGLATAPSGEAVLTDLPPTPGTVRRVGPFNPPVGAPAAGPQLFPIDIAPAIQPDAAASAPASALFPAAFAPGPDSDLDLGAIAFIEPIVNITADSAETVTSGLSLDAFGQAVLVELPPTPATGTPSEPPPPTEVILQEQQEAQDAELPVSTGVPVGAPGPQGAEDVLLAPDLAPSAALAPGILPMRKLLATPQQSDEVTGKPYWDSDPAIPWGKDLSTPKDDKIDFPETLRHRPLSSDEYILFKAGRGPEVSDIQQNQVGNCWQLAALMSHLESGGTIQIRDTTGGFNRFEVIFRPRSGVARVIIDHYVLMDSPTKPFPNGTPFTNTPLIDPVSGKKVAWPLLWVKAYTQLAREFPETVLPGRISSITPAPREGYGDLSGGWAYVAILPLTGRKGTQSAFAYRTSGGQGDTILKKLLQRRSTIAVVSTLNPQTIMDASGYDPNTRTVTRGDWTLQILRSKNDAGKTVDKAYSLRYVPWGYTYVFPFSHAMTLKLSDLSSSHFDVGNPWGLNYRIQENDEVSTNDLPYGNHYVKGLPAFAIQLGFLEVHHDVS